MKRLMIGAAGALLLASVAFVSVIVYGEIGRSRGEVWGSLDGPEPVWPIIVYFSALWIISTSAIVLAALVMTAIVRSYFFRPASSD